MTQAAQTHSRVVCFTQDEDTLKRFLFDEYGRWPDVRASELWWKKFAHEKMSEGSIVDGFKVGIQWRHDAEGVEADQFALTPNPFATLKDGDFIIKERLSFPDIRMEKHFPYILAIQREPHPVVIFPESLQAYYALHDQLSMQGIDHSLDTSGDVKDVHIMRSIRCVEGHTAIVYGHPALIDLMRLYRFEKLVIVEEINTIEATKLHTIRMIEQSFSESPEAALSIDYLNFKTLLHPRTVETALVFMERAGTLRKVRHNPEKVILSKRGAIENDLTYHLIPEGEYTIDQLVNHLRISREDLFPLLKKYEKKGLIFSYSPSRNLRLWALKGIMPEETYETVLNAIRLERQLMADMMTTGDLALNSWLDGRIQKHCLGRGESKAVLVGVGGETEEISPKPSSL